MDAKNTHNAHDDALEMLTGFARQLLEKKEDE